MAVSVGFLVPISSNSAHRIRSHLSLQAIPGWSLFHRGSYWIPSWNRIWWNLYRQDRQSFHTPKRWYQRARDETPSFILSMILGPLSLVLYSVDIEKNLHWMVPIPPTLLIVMRPLELGAITSAEASTRRVSAGLMPPQQPSTLSFSICYPAVGSSPGGFP